MAIQMAFLILIISTLGFICVLGTNCPNGYTLIGFDDLGEGDSPVPSLYQGFSWSNVYSLVSAGYPQSGYGVPLHSGRHVAFNAVGSSMSISASTSSSLETFSINSFVASAAWNNGLVLLITGHRAGTTVYRKEIILQTNLATNVVLNWTHIDKITFITSGGIPASINATGSGTHFAMDNLCITTKPATRRELLYKCDYWGDPQLIQFPKAANEVVSSSWCQISGPSILYQSSHVLINVLNSGSQRGDIITHFNMTFYNSDYHPFCTLTESDVIGTPRTCGSEVMISQTANSLNIAYRKASFSVWISYSAWGGGHYKFNLFTTLAHINEPSAIGLCVQGCYSKRSAPQLLITDLTTDKDIVTSAIANRICDTFMKTATQHLSQNDLVAKITPGYFNAVRRACIIDVTVTGSSQFAQDSVSNIITDILTHTNELKVEDISDLARNTTMIAQQLSVQAEIQVQTMVDGAIWPCAPNAPICIMPSLLRRK